MAMIKMILADDEPIITKGIQRLVDWKSFGIEIVGEYTDGKAALEGIILYQPDIALLDIHMPHMNGVEILKEIKAMGFLTKVIFISGFQDFQYAKDALSFGAKDYLLKPVIKDELITVIEKCIGKKEVGEPGSTQNSLPYDKLFDLEVTIYLPVYVEVLWKGDETNQEKKLVCFSVVSFMEQYLEAEGLGIVFVKDSNMAIVLKGISVEASAEVLSDLQQRVEEVTKNRVGMIIGNPVETMGRIPEEYERCLDMKGYFFFEEWIGVPILSLGGRVFRMPADIETLNVQRMHLTDVMIAQNKDLWKEAFTKLVKTICIISEGKKEDACFHFCTTIRMLEDKLGELGIQGERADVTQLLEKGRQTEKFGQMKELYGDCLEDCYLRIRKSVAGNDKKDIQAAKNYIANHYNENLTLEILARVIHVNSYYFSSYFKKNTGQNFKEYLNQVRMEHAVSLLLSTDMKTYEIADAVGFRDARSFGEVFQRVYGETPSSYRKRVLE